MRNLSFLSLLLVSCSTLKPTSDTHREIASTRQESSFQFDLQLERALVFANGADVVELSIQIKNASGTPVAIDPKLLRLIFDSDVSLGKPKIQGNTYKIAIMPSPRSQDIQVAAIWKNQASPITTIKTFLGPQSVKLNRTGSSFSNMSFVSGLSYTRGDHWPEGQYEGFTVENRGKNRIVHAEDSMRSYDFSAEENASQNISLLTTDAPNGTISHSMHSHFMFFPRTYLPIAEIDEKENVRVTLPTGEEMHFNKDGEVIGGVFSEGPVDISPDRFKRYYTDMKYSGKGILLRANARGQMPQQGQFEATKIDMEYGLKYSTDVLIINGTTGQRCRRPKTDFWPSGDISPIPFKFPTDKEFDVYLKAKCGFGIPELKISIQRATPTDLKEQVSEVWGRCSEKADVLTCLDEEINLIENDELAAKISFETTLKVLNETAAEEKIIDGVIQKEISHIRETLIKDASWVAKGCLKHSQSLVQGSLKYHDLQSLIKEALNENCSTVKADIVKIAATEVKPLKVKLVSDFSWAKVSSKEVLIADCKVEAKKSITSSFRYHEAPDFYSEAIEKLCTEVESSPEYKAWIQTQSAGLEEKILAQVLEEIEIKADEKAQTCLKEFPMDNQINRIRFKRQRESCLTDSWDAVEAAALKKASSDTLVIKVGLSLDNVAAKIALDRRRLQLKLIKKYFT